MCDKCVKHAPSTARSDSTMTQTTAFWSGGSQPACLVQGRRGICRCGCLRQAGKHARGPSAVHVIGSSSAGRALSHSGMSRSASSASMYMRVVFLSCCIILHMYTYAYIYIYTHTLGRGRWGLPYLILCQDPSTLLP